MAVTHQIRLDLLERMGDAELALPQEHWSFSAQGGFWRAELAAGKAGQEGALLSRAGLAASSHKAWKERDIHKTESGGFSFFSLGK